MTFHPAPRKIDSSSWMILPLPRTGPSRRCRLQLTTQTRLSKCARVVSRGGMALEKNHVSRTVAVAATEKMIVTDLVQCRQRGKGRDVSAQPAVQPVGVHDHRHGVPANVTLDSHFGLPITRIR